MSEPMTRGSGVSTFLMLTLAATAVLAAQVRDTTRKHSGLAGIVRDSLGRPLIGANVLVDGSSAATVSDDSGRFDVRRLPAGPNGFTITKIGYAPLSFEVSLPSDSVVVLSVMMRSVQVLNTVNVNAERTNAYLAAPASPNVSGSGSEASLRRSSIDSIAMSVVTPAQLLRGCTRNRHHLS